MHVAINLNFLFENFFIYFDISFSQNHFNTIDIQKLSQNASLANVIYLNANNNLNCAITFFPCSPLVYLTKFLFYFYWKIYQHHHHLKLYFCALICCCGIREGHQNLVEVVCLAHPDVSYFSSTQMRQKKTRFGLMIQNPAYEKSVIKFLLDLDLLHYDNSKFNQIQLYLYLFAIGLFSTSTFL